MSPQDNLKYKKEGEELRKACERKCQNFYESFIDEKEKKAYLK